MTRDEAKTLAQSIMPIADCKLSDGQIVEAILIASTEYGATEADIRNYTGWDFESIWEDREPERWDGLS